MQHIGAVVERGYAAIEPLLEAARAHELIEQAIVQGKIVLMFVGNLS